MPSCPPRPDRSSQIPAFLAAQGWGDATVQPLAADASFRHYFRMTRGSQKAVLMDAPAPWEDVTPFLAVTELLAKAGASVPRVLAQDVPQGFLLLEDFGDASFTKRLQAEPLQERALYEAATEALIGLRTASHATSQPDALPPYDMAVYLREVNLFAQWFLPQAVGMKSARQLQPQWESIWRDVLGQAGLKQDCIVHRDYHADNLFCLPDRAGAQAVGMLDYQDALWGDAAYDLVSLLEDARRDVAPEVANACVAMYLAKTGENPTDFAQRKAVLGAQRNAKIIGIFTRLCVRDGKPHYLTYLPRVWNHFLADLEHPFLQPVSDFLEAYVPLDWCGDFVPDLTLGGMVD